MNKLLLILIVFIFSFVSVKAQSERIIGNWNVNFEESLQISNTSELYDSLGVDHQEIVKQIFSGRTFEFKENQTLLISWTNAGKAVEITGAWELSGDSIHVVFDGAEELWKIEALKEKELVLQFYEEPQGLFSKFSLTKTL